MVDRGASVGESVCLGLVVGGLVVVVSGRGAHCWTSVVMAATAVVVVVAVVHCENGVVNNDV